MKIAIPVSVHDKHLLNEHAECLLKMGGLDEHQVIYFPTLGAKDDTYETAAKLPNATVHPFDMNFPNGAPAACSNHFASVIYALATMGNTDPFLWMELDMLPTAPRWADQLMREYRQKGRAFLGNVVQTPFAENGNLVYKVGDFMMMGCGIYPPGMDRDERIKPLIQDLAKTGPRNPNVPFDIYLRWAIKNIGVADTELIADMWSTQDYRMTPDGIVCDSTDHGDRVVRKRGGLVSPNALLVHGCKDGSLAKLILKGDKAPKVQEAAPKPQAAPSYNEPDERTPVAKPTVTPKPEEKPAAEDTSEITRDAIEKAMKGEKVRLLELSKRMNVKPEILAGTFPRTGYSVQSGGWVMSTIPITKD